MIKHGTILIAILICISACRPAPTTLPSTVPAATHTPASLAETDAATATVAPTPTSTATSVPPSPTPTDTPTPVPAVTLPALAAGEWPAVPQVILEEADHSLWAARFDRGEPWPVTSPLADPVSAVRWAASPDSRWLAVVQSVGWRSEQAAGTLFLVDLERGQARPLAPSLLPPGGDGRDLPDDADRAVLWENELAWSPDGTRLAFLSAHQGSADLYVYELASGEMRRAAAGIANAAWPRWSPDGKTVVYTAVAYFGTGAGPSTEGLWIVPADGSSAPRQLTAGGKQTQALDAWLDTTRILVVSYSVLGQRDLEAIDVESGARTPLVAGELADYAWSEAARLAAASPGEDNEALAPGLYLIDPVGAGASVRVADQQAFRPRWSPSGRYLTFTTGDGCALYDRREDTSRQVEEAWCGGTWSPHERYLAYSDTSLEQIDVETGEVQSLSSHPAVDLRWSPDGGWLLCLRQRAGDKFDLLALRTADGALRPIAYKVSRDALQRATWVPSVAPLAPTSPTIDEILSQGTALPFEVCGESTTWERPPESEQDKWWRSGRYSGADDSVIRYPWTHAFFVTYDHGSTTDDVENLSGLWTLPGEVWARCREPERQDAILKLQTAEVWALYHRVKSIRRLGAHTVVVVEPVESGVQFVQFPRPEQQVPLTFHFVTEDGQEIEQIVEAESMYWPYPGLVPVAEP